MKTTFKNLITVNEALNARFTDLHWTDSASKFEATAELRGEKFLLVIEVSNLTTEKSSYTWLNLAFARFIDGKPVQELVNKGKNQSVIFGAVVNALKDKITELDEHYEIDAVVLISLKSEIKRVSLYEKILSWTYGLNPWKLSAKLDLGSSIALVGTKQLLDDPRISDLEKAIKEKGKSLL
jgi:hypothetical protein